jgi:hypothetical protein
MKKNDNQLFGVGKIALQSPILDLRPFVALDGMVVLLGESQVHIDETFCDIWTRILGPNKRCLCQFYFPLREVTEQEKVGNCKALWKFLRNTDFLSDFYMYENKSRFLFYNSMRDDFAVIAVPRDLIEKKIIDIWDRNFAEHISTAGIGFGKEGELYAKELLAALPEERRKKFHVKKGGH